MDVNDLLDGGEDNPQNENIGEDNPEVGQKKENDIPDEQDLFKMIEANAQKEEKIFKEGNTQENTLICFFKKIDVSKKKTDLIPPEQLKNLNESFGLFYCYQKNPVTGVDCEPGNLMCPKCMQNSQKLYGYRIYIR